MRHKFYIPIGMPNLNGEPSDPDMGDTYFDTILKQVRTWNGSRWTSYGEVTAGAGLRGGGSTSQDIVLDVGQGPGIRVGDQTVSLDVDMTNGLYVQKAGDTMTGPLGLSGNPVDPTQAANKAYVDLNDQLALGLRVEAGDGLRGGGSLREQPTLSVNASSGILVQNDQVILDTGFTNARYAPVSHPHSYSPLGHTHSAGQASVTGAYHVGIRIPASNENGGYFARSLSHNHGSRPSCLVASVCADQGQWSVAMSIQSWDHVNVAVTFRNFNNSTAEIVDVAIISIH